MNLFHSHISEQTHSINNIHCSTRADCLFGVTDSMVLSLPQVFACKAISIHEIPCHHRDTAWLYGEKKVYVSYSWIFIAAEFIAPALLLHLSIPCKNSPPEEPLFKANRQKIFTYLSALCLSLNKFTQRSTCYHVEHLLYYNCLLKAWKVNLMSESLLRPC